MTAMRARLRPLRGPGPVLSREREESLTDRQREILDELGRIFDKGFLDVTMAELAADVNCSLRTLYGLAGSRDELVTMVVDRNIRRVGRAAMRAITDDMTALEAIRAYLSAATVAVQCTTEEFARDIALLDTSNRLNASHSEYIIQVTRTLLDVAVEQGEITPVDTMAVARAIAGVGREFARPDVMPTLASSPKAAADLVVVVGLAGLRRRDVPPAS
ncbi:MAG: TetR/AcrR family transcriptional regulator [Actinomycetota bacterium]